jgi:hypothetical protein
MLIGVNWWILPQMLGSHLLLDMVGHVLLDIRVMRYIQM